MSNPLLDLITQGESGGAGYNAYNRGTYVDANGGKHIRGPNGTIDFSSLTVGEVLDRQHVRSDEPDHLFAVGRYQIIPATMSDAISQLQLTRDERFTPALQDRIFLEHLIIEKRPAIHDFITGKPGISLEAAQRSLALEWASFGDPDKGGASHYGGANHASVSLAQSADALNRMHESYQADVASGLTPEQAWSAVTSNDHARTHAHAHAQGSVQRPAAANVDDPLQSGSHGDSVRTLQTRLAQLGYKDVHGQSLHDDGAFGASTRYAVQAFQRDHQLAVDGKVGPHTRGALNQALQAYDRHETGLLSDPHSAGHSLFKQALASVYKIDADLGRTPDQRSINLAAALTVAAKAQGLTGIDSVAINADGSRALAAQEHTSYRTCAEVFTAHAIHTSVAQSSASWHAAVELDHARAGTEMRQELLTQQPRQPAIDR
ncbi:MAG: peptidoglycan-binding protein [Rhodanobacter sp.]